MIIYKATNKSNGKIYIGQTKCLQERIRFYRRDLKRPKTRFLSALKHYGIDGFIWEVLEECSKGNADVLEIEYISKFNSMNTENGYNQTEGGGGGNTWSGNLHKNETRKRLSDSISNSQLHKQSHQTPEYIKLMTEINRKKASDPLFCERLSKSLKGKPFTELHRKNLSIGSTGKILSDKHKAHISEAVRIRMSNPENRRRISDKLKGRRSPMKGKTASPETRLKMSLAHKKRRLVLDNPEKSVIVKS
jgi:group I intron endonuclease